ncbi:unnamed protein product [Gadus morhua 'NCC']
MPEAPSPRGRKLSQEAALYRSNLRKPDGGHTATPLLRSARTLCPDRTFAHVPVASPGHPPPPELALPYSDRPPGLTCNCAAPCLPSGLANHSRTPHPQRLCGACSTKGELPIAQPVTTSTLSGSDRPTADPSVQQEAPRRLRVTGPFTGSGEVPTLGSRTASESTLPSWR